MLQALVLLSLPLRQVEWVVLLLLFQQHSHARCPEAVEERLAVLGGREVREKGVWSRPPSLVF